MEERWEKESSLSVKYEGLGGRGSSLVDMWERCECEKQW